MENMDMMERMENIKGWPKGYKYKDPEDLLIEADVGLMQVFAGEINLDIEPQSQKLNIERKQVQLSY